jgi:4'-phosphopantetheinyl transferase
VAQEDCLSPDERARAARFRFAEHRTRFIAARRGMRQILGDYLGLDARVVAFHYTEHGKPTLTGSDLPFNLSHSDDLAALAVGNDGEVGIDIERLRPIDEDISRLVFSAAERERLRSFPPEARQRALFHGWVQKEAYLKANGLGLSIAMDGFAVRLDPEETGLLHVDGDELEAAHWQVSGFVPATGFAGAVAARRRGWHLSFRTL